MAQTYDTFWQQRYARLLEEKIQYEAEIVCSGVFSFEEYKTRTGRIQGLKVAIEAIEELNSEIRKAEQGE
jgi:hypothetical protein